VQSRSFAELLEKSVRRYQNRAIEAAQVIEELIAPGARRCAPRSERGEETRPHQTTSSPSTTRSRSTTARSRCSATTLAHDRDASWSTPCARNVTIDWTVKESVRAKLRVIVKRILRKHGYPPDKQEAATNTVLQQAELLSEFWTATA
jgi:type I restriction enzyme R subunit